MNRITKFTVGALLLAGATASPALAQDTMGSTSLFKAPVFVLQPGDWEVGIEDRGHEFLVQDKRTGRIGVMRDLRNIERAPREG